jgi:hypothetical protein
MRNLIFVGIYLLSTMAVALSQVNSGHRIEGIPGGVPGSRLEGISGGVGPASAVPVSTIQGAPFFAEVLSETVRTLPDGSRVSQKQPPSRIYRDSKGRVRYDVPEGWHGITSYTPAPARIYIYDPVAKLQYSLVPEEFKAYAYKMVPLPAALVPRFRSPRSMPGIWANPPELPLGALNLPGVMLLPSGQRAPFQPEISEQLLGLKQMEGVGAEGKRVINKTPVGWNGFERSLEISLEIWVSKDLDCLVSWAMSDPRVGQSSWKLSRIDRSEPDPSLFVVPANFTVVNQ